MVAITDRIRSNRQALATMSAAEATEAEAASMKILDMLARIAEVYLDACRAGLSQRSAFNATRRAFETCWHLPPARAACWARIVVGFVGSSVGERVYTPADFDMIIRRAMGEL